MYTLVSARMHDAMRNYYRLQISSSSDHVYKNYKYQLLLLLLVSININYFSLKKCIDNNIIGIECYGHPARAVSYLLFLSVCRHFIASYK